MKKNRPNPKASRINDSKYNYVYFRSKRNKLLENNNLITLVPEINLDNYKKIRTALIHQTNHKDCEISQIPFIKAKTIYMACYKMLDWPNLWPFQIKSSEEDEFKGIMFKVVKDLYDATA